MSFRREHETAEANWLETERLAPTNQVAQATPFGQKTQCQRPPACYTSMSLNNASNWHAGMATNSHIYKESLIGFESWLAGEANSHVFGKDSSTYNKFSINDPDQWTNITFGNLLRAMGKKAAMENALTHDKFEGSLLEDPLARTDFANPSTISAPYFHPQVEGSQFTMSSGNSSLRDQRTMLGANFDAEVRMPTNTVTDRSSTPKAITDATLRKSTPYQFETITAEKSNRGEKHSSINEAPRGEKKEISGDGAMQLHEKKEKSHLVSDQLSEVFSTQLQENHKGGTDEADLVKIPEQKSRRRKKQRPTNMGSYYGVQSQVTNLLTTKHATDATQNGRPVFEDLVALGPTQRIKRRRSVRIEEHIKRKPNKIRRTK